jgi:hypothetical protein
VAQGGYWILHIRDKVGLVVVGGKRAEGERDNAIVRGQHTACRPQNLGVWAWISDYAVSQSVRQSYRQQRALSNKVMGQWRHCLMIHVHYC